MNLIASRFRSHLVFRQLFFSLMSIFFLGCGGYDYRTVETFQISIDISKALEEAKFESSDRAANRVDVLDQDVQIPVVFLKHFDFRDNPQLKQYESNISNIQVEGVAFDVQENSLNIDFPSEGKDFVVSIGAFESGLQDFTDIGFFSTIPKSQAKISGNVKLLEDSDVVMQHFLEKRAFTLRFGTTLLVETGPDSTLPLGNLVLNVKMAMNISLFVTIGDLFSQKAKI